MATGVYGNSRLATIDIEKDVDIYYHYRENRNTSNGSFGEDFVKYSNPTTMLSKATFKKTDEPIANVLEGMFTLKLPLDTFNQNGIYTILITPKTYYCKIQDAPAVLSALPNVRGVVLNLSDLDGLSRSDVDNMNLVGWRIDYYDGAGEKLDYFRVITSNNFVEPVADNLSSTTQKSISYRMNDASNLIFCTVSPSSASIVKASSFPYIGMSQQQITITNTKFNAQIIEVEMVDTDLSMIANLIAGDQALNLDKGLLTRYNDEHEIIAQTEIVQLKNQHTGQAIYTIQMKKQGTVDKNETWTNVVPIEIRS
jgi:hypothetical protein